MKKKRMEGADILPYERVQVANLTNGKRLETYAIEGEPGSGVICMNGAAARLAEVSDIILVISYAVMENKEAAHHRPKVVHVDENNRFLKVELGYPDLFERSV